LEYEEAKIMAFSDFHLILRVILWKYFKEEVILPNNYQNGSSSTDKAVHGAKAPKNEVEPCQIVEFVYLKSISKRLGKIIF